jgi:NitT/TauT family transport system ATP-binding protein
MSAMESNPHASLLELSQVGVEYTDPSQHVFSLLEDINLNVRQDEIVAIIGPSGSGKTSLIRVASALRRPKSGQVLYRGEPMLEPTGQVGVVFQTPSLFPWMTVQGNIELGLEKLALDPEKKAQAVAWAIDRLGLEGNEEAYPRELSQGMKLRVALARALAPQPELLVLDDPFSGLDVLTAESLRNDLVALWQNTDVNPKAILLVTHDIQEAVSLSSRVLVMDGRPAKISLELANALPYPRDPSAVAFQDTVNGIHDFLTKQILPDDAAHPSNRFAQRLAPLPRADIGQVLGLLEALDDRGGRLDIFDFAAEAHREYSGVVLVVNAAEMLGLVATPKDQAEITDLGRQLLKADVNGRKALLNLQLQKTRLFGYFIEMIERSPEHAIRRELALEQMVLLFPSEQPNQLFNTLVAWARFAELFGYSARRGLLYLDRTFLLDGGEMREMKRAKPGPRPRSAPKPQPETAPLPDAVPEPPAPERGPHADSLLDPRD